MSASLPDIDIRLTTVEARIEEVGTDVEILKEAQRDDDRARGTLAAVDAGLSAQANGLLSLAQVSEKRHAELVKKIARSTALPLGLLADQAALMNGATAGQSLTAAVAVMVLGVLFPEISERALSVAFSIIARFRPAVPPPPKTDPPPRDPANDRRTRANGAGGEGDP